jgi:putative PIN family toxin of toxin-antitoxin system
MRLVVDTNVVVSALLWGGVPRQLLDAIHHGRASAFTSDALIEELREVLAREKFAALIARFAKSPEVLAESYTGIAQLIEPVPAIDQGELRDPKDAPILACAIAAQADAIATGDLDLLSLGSFQDIAILTAADCLGRIAAE